jgi:hypothetical protein
MISTRRVPLLALMSLCTWACSGADAPSARMEDPESPSLPTPPPEAPVTALPGAQEAPPRVGSGTIKSYVEDTEPEPPFLLGSLFENGFILGGPSGMGGAGNDLTDPVSQLGLGLGNLTTLVLFDRSISMSDLWEGQPRWQVAGRAFMNGLVGVEALVTVGTIFFPQTTECDVAPLSDPRQIQFQTGTRFKQHWEAYPQKRFPSGGTPLGPAFEEANDVIQTLEPYGLLPPTRRFRVAIITDGKPNCGTDEDRVLFLAGQWAARGIEITVIGLPGSEEAADFLARLAAYGGPTSLLTPRDSTEAEDSFAVVVR